MIYLHDSKCHLQEKKKLYVVNHPESFIFLTQGISFASSNNAHKF